MQKVVARQEFLIIMKVMEKMHSFIYILHDFSIFVTLTYWWCQWLFPCYNEVLVISHTHCIAVPLPLLEWNMFHINSVQKNETYILCTAHFSANLMVFEIIIYKWFNALLSQFESCWNDFSEVFLFQASPTCWCIMLLIRQHQHYHSQTETPEAAIKQTCKKCYSVS
jgi:hypothetical protein